MLPNGIEHKRQLWAWPTETRANWPDHCTPFVLPSNGVLSLEDSVITLTTNVVFRPECTGTGVHDVTTTADLKDPFYASTIPQTYVIAATTVIAWILVFMLIITPRTNFLGNSGTAPGFSNGHGIIGGATGGTTNLIGVGSRPWLQKVAALTVAISLTIATADTFHAAEEQYDIGYMDASNMRSQVLGSLEIRITRVISDVFVWLAQVQTLIRLFPRHKEKVVIKWIGFALILFDSVFACLNSFMINSTDKPRQFEDAIPALSYLFELALALLYAAWVIFYSLTKRRYAYYHEKMRSIILIATLSLVAVLTPAVFFVTDVSNPDVAGWGDYFRWVGAAAASVVVWEWVERIEALERDEKKDGILGREIFDGDEMLDLAPSNDVVWVHTRRGRNHYRRSEKSDDGSSGTGNQSSALEQGLGNMARRFRPRQHRVQQHFPLGRTHSHTSNVTHEVSNATYRNGHNSVVFGHLPKPNDRTLEPILGGPTPPLPVASPVSREDTTSAASTVYVVVDHPTADVPQPVRRRVDASENTRHTLARAQGQQNVDPKEEEPDEAPRPDLGRFKGTWFSVPHPFKRKRASPPAEVQQAQVVDRGAARVATPAHNFSPWDVKNRMGVLAAETGDRFREKKAARKQAVDLPLTIIPAQPRESGRAWTPSNPNLVQAAQASAEAASYESSPGHAMSGSANLTANSNAVMISQHRNNLLSRNSTGSPLGADGAGSSRVTSPHTQGSSILPPRPNEPTPVAGSSVPVVVPAPRRSKTSHTTATSTPLDTVDDEIHDNG